MTIEDANKKAVSLDKIHQMMEDVSGSESSYVGYKYCWLWHVSL